MKENNIKKLKLAKEMLRFDENLSLEENDAHFDIAYNIINEIVKIKDVEILENLLDFFTESNECTGICEHLKSEIASNYTLEQILQAFYKKFDTLVKNDIEIAVEMSMWFFDSGMFDDFRKMFNAVKTDKSRIFLDEFLDWYPDLEDKVNILRKDMETWPEK